MEEKEIINFICCLPSGGGIDLDKLREMVGQSYHLQQQEDHAGQVSLLNAERLNILLLDKTQFNQFPTDVNSYYRIRFFLLTEEAEISGDLMGYEMKSC
jgi:hypothetical protein